MTEELPKTKNDKKVVQEKKAAADNLSETSLGAGLESDDSDDDDDMMDDDELDGNEEA